LLAKKNPPTFPDRPARLQAHNRLGASGPMPISFILAMFVLPLGIIGVAVILAALSRRADGKQRGHQR